MFALIARGRRALDPRDFVDVREQIPGEREAQVHSDAIHAQDRALQDQPSHLAWASTIEIRKHDRENYFVRKSMILVIKFFNGT